MGQVLHGSATTQQAIRRAMQHSQESLRPLAKRYGIDQKTVAKWKSRDSVALPPNHATYFAFPCWQLNVARTGPSVALLAT